MKVARNSRCSFANCVRITNMFR